MWRRIGCRARESIGIGGHGHCQGHESGTKEMLCDDATDAGREEKKMHVDMLNAQGHGEADMDGCKREHRTWLGAMERLLAENRSPSLRSI